MLVQELCLSYKTFFGRSLAHRSEAKEIAMHQRQCLLHNNLIHPFAGEYSYSGDGSFSIYKFVEEGYVDQQRVNVIFATFKRPGSPKPNFIFILLLLFTLK